MILTPTEKYHKEHADSKHYLNCPKHMFNYQIRSMIRLCKGHLDIARQRVRDAIIYYGHSLKNIDELIQYHWNTSEKEFDKLNPNPYIDNPPIWVIKKTEEIDAWVKVNTEPQTIWNPYPSIPSYPFKY